MPRLSFLPALLVSLLLLGSSRAHMIELAAGKKECFFEDLHAEDKMTVTYQVGGGGHLDIDFWVSIQSPSFTVGYVKGWKSNPKLSLEL